jgi:hypothetical protein
VRGHFACPAHRALAGAKSRGPSKQVRATLATVNLSRPRVQRLSPLFSSTFWKNNYNSFVFINILASPQTDIFSPFVFNNIVELTFILGPPFL